MMEYIFSGIQLFSWENEIRVLIHNTPVTRYSGERSDMEFRVRVRNTNKNEMKKYNLYKN